MKSKTLEVVVAAITNSGKPYEIDAELDVATGKITNLDDYDYNEFRKARFIEVQYNSKSAFGMMEGKNSISLSPEDLAKLKN